MAGAHLLAPGDPADTAHDLGWISSAAWSPTLGHSIGLGVLNQGRDRMGDTMRAWNSVRGQDIPVEICSPNHLDPEGVRQRG